MSFQDRTSCVVLTIALSGCGADEGRDPFPSATDSLGSLSNADGSSSDQGGGGDDDGEDSTGVEQPEPDPWKWDVGPGSANVDVNCESDPGDDLDGDGYTEAAGDCNDCDPNVNPGAIEVQIVEPDENGNLPAPADEDCDGIVDNVPPPCDGAFALDDANPFNAAAAMDLCKVSTGPGDWGVVSAQWVRANGSPVGGATPQFGILNNFGPSVSPQGGSQMLVLSTGRARLPNQPNSCGALTCNGTGGGTAPGGFPQDVPQCPGSTSIYDDIALEVVLRAPTNATGFSYNFDFYSFEYPEWVCTAFNDQYIALMTPEPPGAINGNISFDAATNPVSVNIAFFDVCAGCPLGTGELSMTGFDTWDDAGATSWLVTTAPVSPGQELTLRFAIWDTGDAAWDSTVLIDGFQWIADGSVSVGTQPEG